MVPYLHSDCLDRSGRSADAWRQLAGGGGQRSAGALVAPPLAMAITQRLPAYVHGYVGNVMSMAISTLGIVPLIGLLAGKSMIEHSSLPRLSIASLGARSVCRPRLLGVV